MIYKQFDIVTVPFPFVDSSDAKKRPAIILSSDGFNQESEHSIMAMITSARNSPCPKDVAITNLSIAGLPKASIIRMKLFTLDHRLILSSIGTLSKKDQKSLQNTLQSPLENIL